MRIFDAQTLAEADAPAMPAGHKTILVHGGTCVLDHHHPRFEEPKDLAVS